MRVFINLIIDLLKKLFILSIMYTLLTYMTHYLLHNIIGYNKMIEIQLIINTIINLRMDN